MEGVGGTATPATRRASWSSRCVHFSSFLMKATMACPIVSFPSCSNAAAPSRDSALSETGRNSVLRYASLTSEFVEPFRPNISVWIVVACSALPVTPTMLDHWDALAEPGALFGLACAFGIMSTISRHVR